MLAIRSIAVQEMSNLKAAWHIERIAALRAGRDIAPTHVQIILSDLCNQDCHFCAYRMEGGFSTAQFADEEGNRNPKRFIPTAKVKEILSDCAAAGVGAIEFTGGGEPTVHPDWMEILGFAQGLGMETGLVTNAVRMRPNPVLERLVWLRISLDAGTPETYERIRRSKAWPQVMRNISYAGTLKGPLVGVGFVVTRENHNELLQACQLTKNLGVPYVRISAMFSNFGAGYYDGLESNIEEQIAHAKALLEDERFHIVDFFRNRVEDLRLAAPDYGFCGYQQFVVYIGGNQKVYTCCTNAYTPHGEIGDLTHMRFSEWLAKTRRYDYDPKRCHHCQFNDKNRVIEYLIQRPAHVNFV
jgi:MoaA/NifB/PqqE/SkfB family radical SAM enzyme